MLPNGLCHPSYFTMGIMMFGGWWVVGSGYHVPVHTSYISSLGYWLMLIGTTRTTFFWPGGSHVPDVSKNSLCGPHAEYIDVKCQLATGADNKELEVAASAVMSSVLQSMPIAAWSIMLSCLLLCCLRFACRVFCGHRNSDTYAWPADLHNMTRHQERHRDWNTK